MAVYKRRRRSTGKLPPSLRPESLLINWAQVILFMPWCLPCRSELSSKRAHVRIWTPSCNCNFKKVLKTSVFRKKKIYKKIILYLRGETVWIGLKVTTGKMHQDAVTLWTFACQLEGLQETAQGHVQRGAFKVKMFQILFGNSPIEIVVLGQVTRDVWFLEPIQRIQSSYGKEYIYVLIKSVTRGQGECNLPFS